MQVSESKPISKELESAATALIENVFPDKFNSKTDYDLQRLNSQFTDSVAVLQGDLKVVYKKRICPSKDVFKMKQFFVPATKKLIESKYGPQLHYVSEDLTTTLMNYIHPNTPAALLGKSEKWK